MPGVLSVVIMLNNPVETGKIVCLLSDPVFVRKLLLKIYFCYYLRSIETLWQ